MGLVCTERSHESSSLSESQERARKGRHGMTACLRTIQDRLNAEYGLRRSWGQLQAAELQSEVAMLRLEKEFWTLQKDLEVLWHARAVGRATPLDSRTVRPAHSGLALGDGECQFSGEIILSFFIPCEEA